MTKTAMHREQAMNLNDDEHNLVGKWLFEAGKATADSVCKRIGALIRASLVKRATDQKGWDQLYQDPQDKRLWELNYPQSDLHGGGPPSLTVISLLDAKKKYGGCI